MRTGYRLLVTRYLKETLLWSVFLFLIAGRAVFSYVALHDPKTIYGEIGKNASVRGVVTDLPTTYGNKTNYFISTEEILRGTEWRPINGNIILTADSFPKFSYGDRLAFSCEPESDKFSRLAPRGASASCNAGNLIDRLSVDAGDPLLSRLFRWRESFLERIEQILPEPQAGLLAGLLVGERAGLSDELRAAFRRTGTTHMVAISGFNVSIITSLIFGLLIPIIGRKRGFWLTLIALIGFIFFVGAGASVVRAGVMGSIVLLGKYFGRPGDMLRLLILAAAVMLAANPWLIFDLGFELSFAATFGLLMFSERFQKWLEFLPQVFSIRSTLAETLAATLATLPLTMFAFGQVSVIAPLANLVIMLLVPAAMLVGFLATVIQLKIIIFSAWAVLTGIIGFAETLGSLSFASVQVNNLNWIFLALGIAAVLALAYLLRTSHEFGASDKRKKPWREKFEFAIFVIVLSGLGLVSYAREHPKVIPLETSKSELEITVFDVGQGDAIFVETADGHQMLVDGGPDDTVLAKLGEVMPIGDREIDLVVISHPHADHINGLVSVLERYQIDKIITSGVEYKSVAYDALRGLIQSKNIETDIIDDKETFDFGGAKIDIFYPKKSFVGKLVKNVHDADVVLKVTEDERSILLTGDAEASAETEMISAGDDLRADVLKVGHHGSKTSSSEEFLDAVNPDYAVISVGAGNTYGHPHASVLRRLRDHGAKIFRTDENGDVTIRTDGHSLEVVGSR